MVGVAHDLRRETPRHQLAGRRWTRGRTRHIRHDPGPTGDIDDVIRVIDEFSYEQSIMMNVGDEKGEILDRAVRRVRPRRLLELGTYCGYSALRMARVMSPEARLHSIEFSEANARIAR